MSWYPDAKGLPPDLRRVVDLIHHLRGRLEKLESARFVTESEASARFGTESVAAALEAGGSSPLNVTGLPGKLAEPQHAAVPTVSSLPILEDPLSQDGALVNYNDILYRFQADVEPGEWLPQGAVAVLIKDTHANRIDPNKYPATKYPLNSVFYESDRRVYYHVVLVNGVKTWVLLPDLGVMRDVLANKPTDLGANDVGFLFHATDYNHIWRWYGSGWQYAPGDRVSGEIAWFTENPGVGWALCDGSNVTRTKSDATTASVTLPNLTTGVYPKGGSTYTGNVNAAVAPTLSGSTGAGTPHSHTFSVTSSAVSAGTPSGTVSQPTFTGNPLPAHQHAVPIAMVAGGGLYFHLAGSPAPYGTDPNSVSAAYELLGTAVSTTKNPALSKAESAGTPSGTVSQPTFTGDTLPTHDHVVSGSTSSESSHTHPVGTLQASSTGEPKNIVLLPYYRL